MIAVARTVAPRIVFAVLLTSAVGCQGFSNVGVTEKTLTNSLDQTQANPSTGSPSVPVTPPLTTVPDAAAVRSLAATQIIQAKCLSCHANFNKTSDAAWIAAMYVTPANLAGSSLYRRIANNGLTESEAPSAQRNMPPSPLPALTAGEISTLRSWITNMTVAAPIPSPSPTLTPTTSSGTLANPANANLRLGDRRYVASVLQGAFGESTEVANAIYQDVLTQVGTFGGPRDGQDPTDKNCAGKIENGEKICTATEETQASSLPLSATAREGFRGRTCAVIASKDLAIQHAIAQVRGLASAQNVSISNVTAPSAAELAVAYELFYTNRGPVPASVTGALRTLFDQAAAAIPPLSASNFEGWRFVLYSLCLAPDWQAP